MEQLPTVIINSIANHIAVLDRQGTIVMVNQAWESFAKENGDPALARTGVGINYLDVCRRVKGKDRASAQTALAGVLGVLQGRLRQFSSLEYICRTPKGERWFLLQVTPLPDNIGGAVVSHINITERKQAEAQLHDALEQLRQHAVALEVLNQELQVEIDERVRVEAKLAYDATHDGLTGLPNRVLLMERLQRAIEFGKRHAGYRFSVLFLDLDQFKVINDSLGHALGDQLLITLAQRLRRCVRAGDTVARLGGDEFVILAEDTDDMQMAIALANRIQDELKQPLDLGDQPLFASASIGIVTDLHTYDAADDVLRDADLAMYQAKAAGKARYALFNVAMREQALTRMELENDLRLALARGELELYYQPILSLTQDQVTGFEALLRWRHPRRGLIGPQLFIPVAEETGLIIPIGHWVLEQACCQLRDWQRRFPRTPTLTMNVNVATRQLTDPTFVDRVAATLHASGLDPHTLHLEVTESISLEGSGVTPATFQHLTDLGVQFQIDDFGVGYSLPTYLQYLPIHAVKIDRSFVSQIAKREQDTNIVHAIISLAHNLNMDAVAEGVETAEQLDQLRALNCDYGQGYFLGRPVDKVTIEKWLEAPIVTNGQRPQPPKARTLDVVIQLPARMPAVQQPVSY